MFERDKIYDEPHKTACEQNSPMANPRIGFMVENAAFIRQFVTLAKIDYVKLQNDNYFEKYLNP